MEDHVKDLLDFEKSARYSEKQKAALSYAEAITWRLDPDEAFWERLHRHFGEPGQQSWPRLHNIEHHQVLAGTSAAMAPGYETAAQLARSKAAEDYRARTRADHGRAGS